MEQSDLLIQNAFDLILVLADGLIQGVGGLADSALELVEKLAMWVEEYSNVLADKAVILITTIANAIIENLPGLIVAAVRIIGSLATGLIENLPTLIKQVPTIIAELVKGFITALPKIIDVGKQIIKGLWEGIKSMETWITDKVKGFFSGIVSGVKGLLGIKSPSKVFASIGGYMAEGLGKGWENEYGDIKKQIEGDMNFGAATVDFSSSAAGRYNGAIQSSMGDLAASINQNATIVVQSVLDGKVIGETAYQYSKNKMKAYGV